MTGTTVTPLNMHTDLVLTGAAGGAVTLTGKNGSGSPLSVTVSSGIAARMLIQAHVVLPPPQGAHMSTGVLNMHTDGETEVDVSPTAIAVVGPASRGTGSPVLVRLVVDGPALATLQASGGTGL